MMNRENASILIIDDDARNIFALSAVLRSRGISVLSALSAREGLEILRSNKGIKLVLLDMMMPEMDGYETISAIRDMDGFSDLPVVAVTAQAMIGDREKILNAGASDYISKPIDVDVLMNVLNKFKGGYDRRY